MHLASLWPALAFPLRLPGAAGAGTAGENLPRDKVRRRPDQDGGSSADVSLAAAAAVSAVATVGTAWAVFAAFAFAAARALRAARVDDLAIGGRMIAPPATERPPNPMSPGRLIEGREAGRFGARGNGREDAFCLQGPFTSAGVAVVCLAA